MLQTPINRIFDELVWLKAGYLGSWTDFDLVAFEKIENFTVSYRFADDAANSWPLWLQWQDNPSKTVGPHK